jgi:hypothetical protein
MMLGRVGERGVTLLCALALIAGAASARASGQPAELGVYAMSAGRLGAVAAGLVGLCGVVVGGLALARPTGHSGSPNAQRGGNVAVVAGLSGMALGGLIVATAPGGVGTGGGVGGAILAMLVGLISVVVGGLARARSRRTG